MSADPTSRRRRRASLAFLAAVALLAMFYTVFRETGFVAAWKLHRTEDRLREENIRLREEIARLRGEVQKLKSNPSYIEEIARKELGLIGQKENVIVLDRPKDVPSGAPAKSGPPRP